MISIRRRRLRDGHRGRPACEQGSRALLRPLHGAHHAGRHGGWPSGTHGPFTHRTVSKS